MPNHKTYEEITASLNAAADSGDFAKRIDEAIFARSDFKYVSSERGPGLIDKVYKDGRRVIGRIVGGQHFEEID